MPQRAWSSFGMVIALFRIGKHKKKKTSIKRCLRMVSAQLTNAYSGIPISRKPSRETEIGSKNREFEKSGLTFNKNQIQGKRVLVRKIGRLLACILPEAYFS